MQLSFSKTIDGHEIEFVRLLYPLRYELFFRNANANPIKVGAKKDGNGSWSINETAELPGWIKELSLKIQSAIEENEGGGSNNK